MELNSEINEMMRKKILHWNYRELRELPIIIKKHGAHIREIYLKSNKLKSLPKWIGEMENLQNLYLSGNLIQKLPSEIKFTRLSVLDLNSNQLSLIPLSVASLITLKFLSLDDNFITGIPSVFRKLENLEYLSIRRNRLKTLPEWLGSLEKLEDLIVDCNFLQELPNRLTIAPKLSNISVCSNRLRYLPLNGFHSSTFIRFDMNPDLNYLSCNLLCQLISNISYSSDGDLRNIVSRGCFQNNATESENQNQKLQISSDEYYGTENITIEFPPQLRKIYRIFNNAVCSLTELSLRKLYKTRYQHIFEYESSSTNIKVLYKPLYHENDFFQSFQHFFPFLLMENGPVSICFNYYCQEPIFTESWIIFRLGSQFYDVPTVALFCSHRCASTFANVSNSGNRYFLNH